MIRVLALFLLSLISTFARTAEWTEPDGTLVKSKVTQLARSGDRKWVAREYGFVFQTFADTGTRQGATAVVHVDRAGNAGNAKRVWRSILKGSRYLVNGTSANAQFSPRNSYFVTAVRDGEGHQPFAVTLVAVRLLDGETKVLSEERHTEQFELTANDNAVFDVFDQWPELGSAKRIATRKIDLKKVFRSPR